MTQLVSHMRLFYSRPSTYLTIFKRFNSSDLNLTSSTATSQLPKARKRPVRFSIARDENTPLNQEDVCLFPLLKQLGVSTEGKIQTFSSSCDKIVQFIKLGGINKNIATQYCHYLAEICRSKEGEDKTYYVTKSYDLMSYLLRQDLVGSIKVSLLSDVASTATLNCARILKKLLEEDEYNDIMKKTDMRKLLTCCYKFGEWKLATSFLTKYVNKEFFDDQLIDRFVEQLIVSSSKYQSCIDKKEKYELRSDILKHLSDICKLSCRFRVQFVTKHPQEFIEALKTLDVEIVKNPIIKMSGRCTNCSDHIPLYDSRSTSSLNNSIKELLHKKTKDNFYLRTTPEDLKNFENFLVNLHDLDKRPIDCVIDGPNVAYRNTIGYYTIKQTVAEDVHRTLKRHNVNSQVQVLINTIIRCNMIQKFKKILVIGKDHMGKWPGLLDFFERNQIHFYPFSSTSKDDIYQLYASTFNPKTVLVSNDFFRDHVSLLEGEERIRLERWIDTHQAWIINKNLKAIWPTPYEKIPSQNERSDHFHIPIIDSTQFDTIAMHEPPPRLNCKMTTWICCKVENIESIDGE